MESGLKKVVSTFSQILTSIFIHGQGGGGGPLAPFLRVFVFCSFASNRLVGDTYVRDVGELVTGGSRAQVSVFAEEK